nr:MAG: capsid protein [Cressdnaviricota sp.]
MPPRKFFKKRPIRKSRRKFATRPKKTYPKRSHFKKRSLLKSIQVKNFGVVPTYNSLRIGSPHSQFAKKMEKQYAGAVLNMQNRFTASQTYLAPNLQNYFLFSIFSVNDMATCQGMLGTSLGGIGALNNTARTYYQNSYSQIMMTNSSNAPCYIDLYILRCKRDTVVSPTIAWIDGLKDQNGGTDQTTYIGVNPLDSKYLNVLYQCTNVIHLTLGAGQVHQQNIHVHKHCPINNEILNNVSGNVALAGWTNYILGVARGSPMGASTGSLVATSGSNIDITFNETYAIKQINDQKINYNYNVVTSTGTASNIYNQGSGTSVLGAVI